MFHVPRSFDDDALVAAARAGCHEAFERLVERHHPQLLRYLTQRTGDREFAADVAQDALIVAYRRLSDLPDNRPFAPWLYRIAQNSLGTAQRAHRRKPWPSLDHKLGEDTRLEAACQATDEVADVCEREAIDWILKDLSSTLCEALLLHSLIGFTAPEVAKILGISRAAAERRISRAHQEFRRRYCRATVGGGR